MRHLRALWLNLGSPDLGDPKALAAALVDATVVVNTAHARWTPQVIAAAPRDARLVLMGSTRRFSRWADPHGDGVRLGESAFLASGRSGVMLHPTLIYSRRGNGDIQRLAALLSRLPIAPLPGGGRSLVQPIHQGDVARCLLAAALHPLGWGRDHDYRRTRTDSVSRFPARRRRGCWPERAEGIRSSVQSAAHSSATQRYNPRSAAYRQRADPPADGGQGLRHRAHAAAVGVVPIPLGEGLAEASSLSRPRHGTSTFTSSGTRR